ncbi:Alpha 1,4-glycosyltransferase domain-containing protein [Plasmodiophora brassicae]
MPIRRGIAILLLLSGVTVLGFICIHIAWDKQSPQAFHYDSAQRNGTCRVLPWSVDYIIPNELNHAFSVVTQPSIPRAYSVGYETFFRHHPSATLYIISNVESVDRSFERNGFRVVLVPLDLQLIMDQLLEALPSMKATVFDTDVWRNQIVPYMMAHPMVLSDFIRLAMLYMYGGSWIDADAIYLRPFAFRNALPCHDRIIVGQPYVQCDDSNVVHIPFNGSMPVRPGRSFYVTNGIMGGWERHHPFIRKALLRMPTAFVDTLTALGGILLVDTLVHTALTDPGPTDLLVDEWPNLYDIDQLFGFFNVDEFAERWHGNVPDMIDDLARRRVYSVQIMSGTYEKASLMQDAFADGSLYATLWLRNCVFSCHEPIQ